MGGRITRQGLLFFICTLLAANTANAAFITDKIVVEVRTERFGQGSVLKKLPSGTSVEVLMSDGKYTRVRTTDNITGWVASTFLTNKKPTQLEYMELLSKSKATEAKLRAAEEKLAGNPGTGPAGSINTSGTNSEDIETLKNEAKNARWMKVEMQKARDRADQAEAKLRIVLKKQTDKGKQDSSAKQQLAELQNKNNELEKRLAASALINQQQNENVEINPIALTPIPTIETIREDGRWSVGVKWFFGSLSAALIVGFFAGIKWLDKRSRQRHGGFRIY